ncbi:MAG: hypothetical protein K5799_01855 [Erythrobacter sp.]|nr:hypothetical protein [Erythrobacter sp.]
MKYLLGFLALIAPGIAHAEDDWWFAESDHFRVYSSGGEAAARKMAVELERVDQAMRLFTGVGADQEVAQNAKPTIYQFGKTEDIGKLAGQEGVAGFFIPRAGNSVAFVPLEQGRKSERRSSLGARTGVDYFDFDIPPESVLFHEYAHYFMFQHAPTAYPPWYIEGLAELFGSLKIEEVGFSLGDPPEHRKGEISLVDVDTDQIFRSDDRNARQIRYPYYGHGWLLTSYLSFAPERSGQLAKFLRSLNQGVETRAAARDAFGDLNVLEKELNAYRRQRARGMQARFTELEQPTVETRELTPAQSAQMAIQIESKSGVTAGEAKAIASRAQALLAQYPNDPAVLRSALEAEYDTGNFAAAESLAQRLLNTEYAVDAQLYLARVALQYAPQDKSWVQTARTHFVAANRADSEDPNALKGFYLTYRLLDEEPPESALIALERAYEFAPFDPEIRMLLAHLLILENRDETAINLLRPVIYQPHGGKEARELRELVEKFEKGEREPLIEKLAPKLSGSKGV